MRKHRQLVSPTIKYQEKEIKLQLEVLLFRSILSMTETPIFNFQQKNTDRAGEMYVCIGSHSKSKVIYFSPI